MFITFHSKSFQFIELVPVRRTSTTSDLCSGINTQVVGQNKEVGVPLERKMILHCVTIRVHLTLVDLITSLSLKVRVRL